MDLEEFRRMPAGKRARYLTDDEYLACLREIFEVERKASLLANSPEVAILLEPKHDIDKKFIKQKTAIEWDAFHLDDNDKDAYKMQQIAYGYLPFKLKEFVRLYFYPKGATADDIAKSLEFRDLGNFEVTFRRFIDAPKPEPAPPAPVKTRITTVRPKSLGPEVKPAAPIAAKAAATSSEEEESEESEEEEEDEDEASASE